jgi:hypothetical protein
MPSKTQLLRRTDFCNGKTVRKLKPQKVRKIINGWQHCIKIMRKFIP